MGLLALLGTAGLARAIGVELDDAGPGPGTWVGGAVLLALGTAMSWRSFRWAHATPWPALLLGVLLPALGFVVVTLAQGDPGLAPRGIAVLSAAALTLLLGLAATVLLVVPAEVLGRAALGWPGIGAAGAPRSVLGELSVGGALAMVSLVLMGTGVVLGTSGDFPRRSVVAVVLVLLGLDVDDVHVEHPALIWAARLFAVLLVVGIVQNRRAARTSPGVGAGS